MNKIIKLILLFLIFIGNVNAQEVEFRSVDYNAIEKTIKDKKSEFYYPTLMERFQKMDTTMTVEHLYHLYYGQTFQKEFDINAVITKPKNIEAIEDKESAPTPAEVKILKEYYTEIYHNQPFDDLSNIEILAIIYSFEENEDMIKKLLKMYYGLVDALLLTGDGNSLETAIDVITVKHEYNLLNLFGLYSENQSLLKEKGRSYDLLSAKNEEDKEFEVYFDVTRLFEFYDKKFK